MGNPSLLLGIGLFIGPHQLFMVGASVSKIRYALAIDVG